jgi:hypothetical protein
VLVALGRKLGLEANLERAQEAVYEALQGGRPASEEMRELGRLLGITPSVLIPPELAEGRDAQLPAEESALP